MTRTLTSLTLGFYASPSIMDIGGIDPLPIGARMNRTDLRRVDLNLLIVFETLMLERSVTRAAEKLFLGQPAISAALARLRTLFDDPLFVRTGRSMEPTPRAQEIAALLSPALDQISSAVSRTQSFEPASADRVFRVGLSDDVEFALLPPLLRRIRIEAPGTTLVVRRMNYLTAAGMLASGEITVAVGYTEELPANAKRRPVRRFGFKVLRADSKPGRLTLDEYCARPHALVSYAGDLTGYVDELLDKLGRQRRVVLAVPQFNGLGSLLAETDLLVMVPDYTARLLASTGGLRYEDPTEELRDGGHELPMAWSGAQDHDLGERWLRSRIQMFIGDPDSL